MTSENLKTTIRIAFLSFILVCFQATAHADITANMALEFVIEDGDSSAYYTPSHTTPNGELKINKTTHTELEQSLCSPHDANLIRVINYNPITVECLRSTTRILATPSSSMNLKKQYPIGKGGKGILLDDGSQLTVSGPISIVKIDVGQRRTTLKPFSLVDESGQLIYSIDGSLTFSTILTSGDKEVVFKPSWFKRIYLNLLKETKIIDGIEIPGKQIVLLVKEDYRGPDNYYLIQFDPMSKAIVDKTNIAEDCICTDHILAFEGNQIVSVHKNLSSNKIVAQTFFIER